MKCYECKAELPHCDDCEETAAKTGSFDKWFCDIYCMNMNRKARGLPAVALKDVLPSYNIGT